MLLQLFFADFFVLDAQFLVEIILGVVGNKIAQLDACFLASQGHRRGQVIHNALVKPAFVRENDSLRGYYTLISSYEELTACKEKFVDEAKFGEAEKEDECCKHKPVFCQFSFISCLLLRACFHQRKTSIGEVLNNFSVNEHRVYILLEARSLPSEGH